MKASHAYIGLGLIALALVALFLSSSESLPEGEPERAVVAGHGSTAAVERTVYRRSRADEIAEAEATAARVEQLKGVEAKKKQRDEAAEKMQTLRARMQLSRHAAWQALVESHQKEFEDLKMAAAQAPDQRVPCSICGAQGVLDLCVLCDHTGQCPNCRGTGKVFDEICPACSGRGKCFLCSGSGKMPCPFCQSSSLTKEVITPGTPNPPADFPLD